MSDNIDYTELDKAVNEAMRAQSGRRQSAKPTTKPTAQHPIARPQSRGRFIDFAPHGVSMTNPAPVKTTPKPLTHQATTQSTPRKIIQQRPLSSNVSRQAVIKPTSRISATHKTPGNIPKAPTATSPNISRPNITARIQQKQDHSATTSPKQTLKPIVAKKTEAPDANSYSLGGRSPFLVDTKVEKRPLGNRIPETSTTAIRSTKNIYSQKNPAKAPVAKRKKHTVTEAPKSHSGWLWSLVVLLVIAAGAGLGYLAYLIVFAN